MKTRIAVAIATLLVASMGAAAYAQAQQTTPEPMSASSTSTSTTTTTTQSNKSMSNGDMSNDWTEREVKKELKSHGVTPTNVSVTFEDGTATLTGTVATKRDIRKAKSAAMRVRGVKHVDTSGLQVQARDDG